MCYLQDQLRHVHAMWPSPVSQPKTSCCREARTGGVAAHRHDVQDLWRAQYPALRYARVHDLHFVLLLVKARCKCTCTGVQVCVLHACTEEKTTCG